MCVNQAKFLLSINKELTHLDEEVSKSLVTLTKDPFACAQGHAAAYELLADISNYIREKHGKIALIYSIVPRKEAGQLPPLIEKTLEITELFESTFSRIQAQLDVEDFDWDEVFPEA